MRTFALVNQSCYRRQEEVARVKQFLFMNGYDESEALESADLAFLFTCAFCQSKMSDMLDEIARIRSVMPGHCRLVVGGCLPETAADELKKNFDGETISPRNFQALNRLPGIKVKVEDLLNTPAATDQASLPAAGPSGATGPTLPLVEMQSRNGAEKRVGVFIASGCRRKCSYCAIRFATGPLKSRPLELVTRTFSEGLNRGYRKFEIYADSVGDYGKDIGTSLGELLDWLSHNDRKFSVGLYDLLPEAFLEVADRILSLCKAGKLHYLYVPLQSGNPRVLRRMNRLCDLNELLLRLKEVRRQEGVFLQTGIMIGFPGETDAEFADTLSLLQAVQFDDVYVHFYSDMPNTPASRFPEKIDKDVMFGRQALLSAAGVRHNAEKTLHEWENMRS